MKMNRVGVLALISVVLFVVRGIAATRVGFGDSEALYATWAIHPQPAYLDHPGLVGLIARGIGEGAVPTPFRTHMVTSVIATLIPWLVFGVARWAGAEKERAASTAIVFAVVPEIAIGLFALTPDLALSVLWLGSLGLAIVGLSSSPTEEEEKEEKKEHVAKRKSELRKEAAAKARAAKVVKKKSATRAAWALIGAGLLAGAAASAKVSGFLLMASLLVTYVTLVRGEEDAVAEGRNAMRGLWPWAGLLAGVVVVLPMIRYEAALHFPMFKHRVVDTQVGAGLAFQNFAKLLGGQLLYLSPVIAVVTVIVAHDLFRRRKDDAVSRLLFCSFAIPILPLIVLCVWSPVAEPHWIAPPLLALPIHAARRGTDLLLSPRFVKIGAAVGALMTLAVHGWVLIPSSASLLPRSVDPRNDISNELYGWPQAIEAVKEQMRQAATPFDPEGRDVVVVGPHWTICAQLHAALPGIRVGCTTTIPDDFDRWSPRDVWRQADVVLFVADTRYQTDGADQLPAHSRVSQSRVRTLRGGRTARVFDLYLYSRATKASN
jgi:hypothetical protein